MEPLRISVKQLFLNSEFNRGEIQWDQDMDLSDESAQLFVLEATPETPSYDS